MAVLHADIERLIAAAGLESTIIRPGMLASNVLFWWAPAIRTNGIVWWPYGAAETAPVYGRSSLTGLILATVRHRTKATKDPGSYWLVPGQVAQRRRPCRVAKASAPAGAAARRVIPRWQYSLEVPAQLGVQDGMLRAVQVAGCR